MISNYTEWCFLLDIYIWSIKKYPYSNSTDTAWQNTICELIMTALDTPYHDCEMLDNSFLRPYQYTYNGWSPITKDRIINEWMLFGKIMQIRDALL